MSLAKEIRSFLEKHGPASITEILGACGKRISATTALRSYERTSRNNDRYFRPGKKKAISQQRKIEIGKRHVIADRCLNMLLRGWLVRKSPGVYTLSKKVKSLI